MNNIDYCQWILNNIPVTSPLYQFINETDTIPERKIELIPIGYSCTPMKKQDDVVLSEDEEDN